MSGPEARGVLYPARLPTFHRLPVSEPATAWVRWFWVPEWDLAPGRSSRQELIAFPASNLVVEPDLVGLSGPTTRLSHRDLTGRGWAVGALLRPAAVPDFAADPGSLRDSYLVLDLPDLHAQVATIMAEQDDPSRRRERAVAAFTDWLVARLDAPGEEALLANTLADVVEDSSVLRLEDVASTLGVSIRTVQRLARRYVGLPPAAMIRRRRLQEAAQRIREHPDTDLATMAAELGYADQAHLAGHFRSVLGFTPSNYRGRSSPSATARGVDSQYS